MSAQRPLFGIGSCLIQAAALLVFPVIATAQFPAGTSELFGTTASVNTPFTRANWSVDPGCSTGLVNSTLSGRGWNGVPLIMPRGGTGTRMIVDLNPGAASSTIGEMVWCGNDVVTRLLFAADAGAGPVGDPNAPHGMELYRAYQVLYPTVRLEGTSEPDGPEINPGAASSNPTQLFRMAAVGNVLFAAADGTNGNELWKFQTAADFFGRQHEMIKDINIGSSSSDPAGFSLTTSTGPVVFAATGHDETDPQNPVFAGRELFRTGGAIDGSDTSILVDINQTPDKSASSNPEQFVRDGGGATAVTYFTADDGVNGRELWRTDGTFAGTGMLKDIVAGPTGSNPANLAVGVGVLATTLFFSVDSDGVNGMELWKSNGSLDGSNTVMVKDVGGTLAHFKVLSNPTLMFFIRNNELWKSDGTDPNTVMVQSFTSIAGPLVTAGGFMYFAADDGSGSGMELWKSDGTTTSLVLDINPGAAGSSPGNLLALGSTVYFAATTAASGRELWRTDSTLGAVMILDIRPGAASSNPANLNDFSGTVVFTADDGAHGTELWQSDGGASPAVVGVSHKWDLAPVIQSLPNGTGKIAVAGTNQNPFVMGCNILDAPTSGGGANRLQCKQIAHQFNGLVELTDGTDRAPVVITNVDCGDGAGWTRPRASLSGDGQPHNVIAAGMLAILDQDPCDVTSFGSHDATESPAMPVMPVPVIYDGLNWRPMDLAHFPDMKQSVPGATLVNQFGQAASADPPPYMSNNPADFLPNTIVNPWATKRFMSLRLIVRSDSFDVIWSKRQGDDDGLPQDAVWMVTVPRQYTGAFTALHVGTPTCTPTPYEAYFDYLFITGGKFASSLTPSGACCSPSGCTDVTDASQCPGGTFSMWDVCTGPGAITCCGRPWADADRDGDVDSDDYGDFQTCYTGATVGVPAGCTCLNRINDTVVNSLDFDEFVKCRTGPEIPFNPGSPPAGCDISCPAGTVCPP